MELIDIIQFGLLGVMGFFIGLSQFKICRCPICQHTKELSDEAIKDIIEDAIPETGKSVEVSSS